MKKMYFVFITLLIVFSFNIDLKAECRDEDLNEWATTTNVKFMMNKEELMDKFPYAYYLYISPDRDDVYIKVTDGENIIHEGQRFDPLDIYGIGCYTNIYEEKFIVEIYGGENSKCKNELLKTITYTVPPYNDMIMTEQCEKFPEHELCKPFTEKTQSMSEAEFKKEMKKYENVVESKKFSFKKLLDILKEYIVYILFPFFLITLVYIIKIQKYKKKESNE